MNCVLFKKSSMNPLPSSPDPAANPGEFGLVDNEDETLTLVIVDPHGKPSPIDPTTAAMTVDSDAPNVVRVDAPNGFTFGEHAVGGSPATSAAPGGGGTTTAPGATSGGGVATAGNAPGGAVPASGKSAQKVGQPPPAQQPVQTTGQQTTQQLAQQLVQGPASGQTQPAQPTVQVQPPGAPGSGATANITITVQWSGGNMRPHKLTWKDTIVNDPADGVKIQRGPVTVTQP